MHKRRHIASGGEGDVWEGTWEGQTVAMKVIKFEAKFKRREKILAEFVREVDIAARLRHPNIVQVFGAVTSEAGSLTIVMMYAPDGSLRDLLDQVLLHTHTHTHTIVMMYAPDGSLRVLLDQVLLHTHTHTNRDLLDKVLPRARVRAHTHTHEQGPARPGLAARRRRRRVTHTHTLTGIRALAGGDADGLHQADMPRYALSAYGR